MFSTTFSALMVALALTSLTSATNIDNHFGANCGGSYLHYANIGQRVCANAVTGSGSSSKGSQSIYFSSKPSSAHTYGWQSTNNGMICGSILTQGGGGGTTACLKATNGLQYAGSSWSNVSKKRFASAEAPKCTSTVGPDALVLADGHKFGVQNMTDALFVELYEAAYNGASFASLPGKFHAYEVDAAGVAGRLAAIAAR